MQMRKRVLVNRYEARLVVKGRVKVVLLSCLRCGRDGVWSPTPEEDSKQRN